MLFISYLLTVSSIDLLHATRQLYTRLRIDGIKVISRGILGGKQVIKFANKRSRGRVCLFYQNDLIFMQKVQAPEKARRPFMKLSVHEIVSIAHAWAELVTGLLFSPRSFCNSADPPWIPGFCSSWFCIREQGYCLGCFSYLLSQINHDVPMYITRQPSYFCQLIAWRWHFKTRSNSLARVFRSQMNTWQMYLSSSSYNSMVSVRSIFILRQGAKT